MAGQFYGRNNSKSVSISESQRAKSEFMTRLHKTSTETLCRFIFALASFMPLLKLKNHTRRSKVSTYCCCCLHPSESQLSPSVIKTQTSSAGSHWWLLSRPPGASGTNPMQRSASKHSHIQCLCWKTHSKSACSDEIWPFDRRQSHKNIRQALHVLKERMKANVWDYLGHNSHLSLPGMLLINRSKVKFVK